MDFETIKKLIKGRKKLLISLGLLPVAFITAHAVNKAVKNKKLAPKKSVEPAWEIENLEKIMAIKELRTKLEELGEQGFTIHFGRSKKEGNWGYYIQNKKKSWIFFCCSDEFEKSCGGTSYWIELDETASDTLKKTGMDEELEVFTHPKIKDRIIVSILPEEMKEYSGAALKIKKIAITTLKQY